MDDITYAVSVDVNNPIIPYNVYVASVLDSNVRYLEITLYQNGNVVALSNTATATASLVTDNVLVNDSVNCTIQDNIITVPLEDLQRHGNLDVQVTVTEGTKVLAIPFPIQVRVTPNIAENAQIDENSLGSYAEVVQEIVEARGDYETLNSRIAAAPSFAEVDEAKVSKPSTSPNGTNGQLLRTKGDGTTEWVDVIDSTLSTQGAAADAKKTGDEITDLKSALNNDSGSFFANILPSMIAATWSRQGNTIVISPETRSSRFAYNGAFTADSNYVIKAKDGYNLAFVRLNTASLSDATFESSGWVQSYTIKKGQFYFVGFRRNDETNITISEIFDNIVIMPIQKLYGDVAFIKGESNNDYVKSLKSLVVNKTINIQNNAITWAASTKHLSIPQVISFDFPIHIKMNDGYFVNVREMADDTTNASDIILTSAWVNEFDVPKNTLMYLVFRNVDTTQHISSSDFENIVIITLSKEEHLHEFDLIVFAGQSNMAGRGITSTTYPETAPTIIPNAGFEYRAITNQNYLVPIAEPFGVNENKQGGINDGNMKTGSMVTAFANAYYLNNGHIPIVGVSASKGGSGIDEWQPNTAYLNDALDRLDDAKAFMTAKGLKTRHIFLAWCQGEHEGTTPDPSDDPLYNDNFKTMFAEWKTHGVEKCLLFRIGEANRSDVDFSVVIQKQTELAQTDDDVIMATTCLAGFKADGMMKDDWHYYQKAYNIMGEYGGVNCAEYVTAQKEPTMYDPKYNNLYYCHKN